MYRLNPDTGERLAYLRASEIEQVCVGKYDLQFRLHPRGHVRVWARCELIENDGSVADVWQEDRRSPTFRFLDLLGATVASVAVDSETTLRLRFEDGRQLLLIDVSEQYESFSVDDLIV